MANFILEIFIFLTDCSNFSFNSSTVENTTVNKPTAKKTGPGKSSVEYKPLEPSVRNQGDLVKETSPKIPGGEKFQKPRL